MKALAWYQGSLLLRSHRWIPPAVLFVIGVFFLGGSAGQVAHGAALGNGLSWSALMLVPVVAWLTRTALTAEPAAARACVAAAGGPRRAQLAALTAGLVAGAGLGLVGIIWELVHDGVLRQPHTNTLDLGATTEAISRGIGAALICLLVGSAIGALCNPPLVRRPATAMLTTTGSVVLALAWSVSPANAAVRTTGSPTEATTQVPAVPVIEAIALLVVAWTISALVAARRSG